MDEYVSICCFNLRRDLRGISCINNGVMSTKVQGTRCKNHGFMMLQLLLIIASDAWKIPSGSLGSSSARENWSIYLVSF